MNTARHYKLLLRAKLIILFSCLLTACQIADAQRSSANFVSFEKFTLDEAMSAGYGVEVADIDGDGLADIIALATNPAQLAWYKNPGWEKYVINSTATSNIDSAPMDIDGDGDTDIVLASAFSLRESSTGGLVHWLENPGNPAVNQDWEMHFIDEIPTSHRLKWGDINGDGEPELVNLPIVGAGASAPLYQVNLQLVAYSIPDDLSVGSWPGVVLDQSLQMSHGFDLMDWDSDGRTDIITASFDGVHLLQLAKRGEPVAKSHIGEGLVAERPARGSSEVDVGELDGERFVATIEPWHGNQVVVYSPGEDQDALWQRAVIETEFNNGHALLVDDLDNDGLDEIIAGQLSEPFSAFIYRYNARAALWDRIDLDLGGISLSGLAIYDLNGDGYKDIVGVGGATENVVYYQNSGK